MPRQAEDESIARAHLPPHSHLVPHATREGTNRPTRWAATSTGIVRKQSGRRSSSEPHFSIAFGLLIYIWMGHGWSQSPCRWHLVPSTIRKEAARSAVASAPPPNSGMNVELARNIALLASQNAFPGPFATTSDVLKYGFEHLI